MTGTYPAIAFVGSLLPLDMCDRSPFCHPAGNKFQLEFVQALRQASGCTPAVFSVPALGMFPKSRRVLSSPASLDLGEGLSCQLVPFVNVLLVKQVTIALSTLFLLTMWLLRNRHRRRYVLVQNVYPPMALPVLLATRLFGGRPVAVVADLPHNLSFDFRGPAGLLQRADVFVETRSLSHFAAIIPFTRYIAEDFAPRRPMLVMEGGVEPGQAGHDARLSSDGTRQEERICLFSGTLHEVNGVDLLMNAFAHLPNPEYRLWILGRGPLESLVQASAARDPRIVYLGFVPNNEVRAYQRRATVLLNARPSNQAIARYTFPSKLREYMLSGRPVITTLLAGIPEEYYDYLYLLRDETAEGLAELLQQVCSRSAEELDEFGRRAQVFITQNRNWARQGRRVYEFISELY